MTSREVVINTINFNGIDRLAIDFPAKYGSDFYKTGMTVSEKYRVPPVSVSEWEDEWGVKWKRIGNDVCGQPVYHPLKDINDIYKIKIPDFDEPERWSKLKDARDIAKNKFLMANGLQLYERIHLLHGIENTWADICQEPDKLGELIDLLVDINIKIIMRYREAGVDGFFTSDDWGLQDRLMISPKTWRKIWKPRYARMYKAAHDSGMLTFLHSCGYIVDILDDLIEIGLDVIQIDQQEHMGLELLNKKFTGRITFYAPVDIQKTMIYGSFDDIRAYCRKMVKFLNTEKGGFIPKWYVNPQSAGHSAEKVDVMCEEFLKISREIYGKP